MAGKHYKYIGKHSRVIKTTKGINPKIVATLLMLFILLISLHLFKKTYAKYVVNKELIVPVKTAEYHFTAESEEDEYIAQERNNCNDKFKQ